MIQIASVGKLNPEPILPGNTASTSRLLWICAYVILMVLVALRLPLTKQYLSERVPADVRAELGDDRLLSLSITVGTVIFFLMYAVIMGLYLSLAALLDRRLVPGKVRMGRGLNVGVFFVIAMLATIPPNAFSVASGIVQPREVPGYWYYFPFMTALVLAVFRRHWLHFSLGKKVLIALSALTLSAIVAIG
ncbi:hypothetical protein AB6813_10260 [bacterium RCC_150]